MLTVEAFYEFYLPNHTETKWIKEGLALRYERKLRRWEEWYGWLHYKRTPAADIWNKLLITPIFRMRLYTVVTVVDVKNETKIQGSNETHDRSSKNVQKKHNNLAVVLKYLQPLTRYYRMTLLWDEALMSPLSRKCPIHLQNKNR